MYIQSIHWSHHTFNLLAGITEAVFPSVREIGLYVDHVHDVVDSRLLDSFVKLAPNMTTFALYLHPTAYPMESGKMPDDLYRLTYVVDRYGYYVKYVMAALLAIAACQSQRIDTLRLIGPAKSMPDRVTIPKIKRTIRVELDPAFTHNEKFVALLQSMPGVVLVHSPKLKSQRLDKNQADHAQQVTDIIQSIVRTMEENDEDQADFTADDVQRIFVDNDFDM
jgi:hypothetical protein